MATKAQQKKAVAQLNQWVANASHLTLLLPQLGFITRYNGTVRNVGASDERPTFRFASDNGIEISLDLNSVPHIQLDQGDRLGNAIHFNADNGAGGTGLMTLTDIEHRVVDKLRNEVRRKLESWAQMNKVVSIVVGT